MGRHDVTDNTAVTALIGDIYDASVSPSRWPEVMRTVGALGDAERVAFIATDLLNPGYNLVIADGIPADKMREYREQGLDREEFEFVNNRWLAPLPLGEPAASNIDFGNAAGYRAAGGRWVEFLNGMGIYHQASVLFDRSDFRLAGMGLNNGEARPFRPETLAFIRHITPHMRRAMQIHRQLALAELRQAALYRTLDQLRIGVILVDADTRIRYCNPEAEKLLAGCDALRVALSKHTLRATAPADDDTLQAMLRSAAGIGSRRTPPDGVFQGILAMRSVRDASALALTVTPLSELAGYAELASDGIAAAVFMTDPTAPCAVSRARLASAYSLSGRELDVCEVFLNAPDIPEIAGRLGISVESVRTHLKNVFSKTGQHSQPELMRLLMGLALRFEHIG